MAESNGETSWLARFVLAIKNLLSLKQPKLGSSAIRMNPCLTDLCPASSDQGAGAGPQHQDIWHHNFTDS